MRSFGCTAIAYVSLFIVASCIFLSFHPEYYTFADFYNQKRVLALIVIVITLLVAFLLNPAGVFEQFTFRRGFKNLGLYVFFAIGLISVALSDRPINALHEWLNFLFLWIFVVSLVVLFERYKLLCHYTIIFLSLCSGLYLAKFAIVLFLSLLNGYPVDQKALVSGVVNENFIAQPLAMLAPFFAVWAMNKVKFAWAWGVCFFISLFFMIIIYNRSVVLTLFIVFAVWAVYAKTKKSLSLLMIYFVCFGFALLLVWLIVHFFGMVGVDGQVKNLLSDPARELLWYEALLMGVKNPFLGIGPYGYTFITPINGTAHPHNFYLQLIAEWGFAATCILGVTATSLFITVIKAVRLYDGSPLFLGAFLGLFEGVLHAGLSGVLVMPLSQVVFCILVAVLINSYRRLSYTQKATVVAATLKRNKCVYASFVVVILSCLSLYVFVSHSLSLWANDSCVTNIGPRYWVDGGIVGCY